MKNNKERMKLVCEKCGEEAEINKKDSNENWKVYYINRKCKKCNNKKYTLSILFDKLPRH